MLNIRRVCVFYIAALTAAFSIGCKSEEYAIKTFFTSNTYFSVTLPQNKEELAEAAFAEAGKNAEEGAGYAADKTAGFLRENGIKSFMVNFGGSIYSHGRKNGGSFTAGIPDPKDPNKIISVIGIKNAGVSTYPSAGKTGDGFYASVSVLAENASSAENLAETYYGMEKDEISAACGKNKTPALVVGSDGKTDKFCGWEKLEVK